MVLIEALRVSGCFAGFIGEGLRGLGLRFGFLGAGVRVWGSNGPII